MNLSHNSTAIRGPRLPGFILASFIRAIAPLLIAALPAAAMAQQGPPSPEQRPPEPPPSVEFIKIPDDVFTLENNILAVRLTGTPGHFHRDLRIPLDDETRLKDVSEAWLIDYDAPRPREIPFRAEGRAIHADLMSGHTYIYMPKPDAQLGRFYDFLCHLNERRVPLPDLICQQILCPPGPDGPYNPDLANAEALAREYGVDVEGLRARNLGSPGGPCGDCLQARRPRVIPSDLCFEPSLPPSGSGEAEAEPPPSNTSPMIAFTALADPRRPKDTTDIYTIHPDGTNRRNLTNDEAIQYLPKWSPSGDWLAYVSEVAPGSRNPYALFVIDADGDRLSRATAKTYAHFVSLAWKSDHAIAFIADERREFDTSLPYAHLRRRIARDPSRHDSWVDIGRLFSIYPEGSDEILDLNESVSASPIHPAYIYDLPAVRRPFGRRHLVISESDSFRILTETVGETTDYETDDFIMPDWSARDEIAMSVGPRVELELHSIRSDGSDFRKLRDRLGVDGGDLHPAWSPAGERIAFRTTGLNPDRTVWDLCLIDRDGSGFRNLTQGLPRHGPVPFNSEPRDFDWSPDGSEIVYTAWQEPGRFELWIVDATSGDSRKLTSKAFADLLSPDWRPKVDAPDFHDSLDSNRPDIDADPPDVL